jgi:hypothetical protein
VTVDGADQARSLGPHLWGRRYRTTLEANALTPAMDYVRASHDGYRASRASAVHTRSVIYLKPDLLLVLDRVRAKRACEGTLLWQLQPGDEPERMAGGEAAMTVAVVPRGTRKDSAARYSPRYTWQTNAPRFAWSAVGSDLVFASVIALAFSNAVAPRISLSCDGEQATVDITKPRVIRITERWTAPTPQVTF